MAVGGKRWLVHPIVFFLYLCFILGNAVFVLNPMNVSTCMGSTAVFSCAVNESVTVAWNINGEDALKIGVSPTDLPPTLGPVYPFQLKVNATSQLHGASVSCYYVVTSPHEVIFSTTAYLAVQGPPTNLTIIQLNATIYKMDWGLQFDIQPTFLFTYYVEVRNEIGAVVYNESVSARQLIISSLDPCGRYLATVIARCQYTSEVYNISAWFIGDQPSRISNKQITDTFMFSQDNVTMRISQPGVCYFRMEAVSGSDVFLFPHLTPLLSNGDQTIAAVSLPTNKLYTINITAYNVYGHNSSTFTMSTFDIIDIICDINLTCIYNTGSFARGCLLKIINSATNNTAYCRGIERSLNTSFSTSLCSSCNGLLSTGVYIAEAYDVERDETVSTVPAVRVNLTLPGCALPGASTCTIPGPSTYSGIPIDGIIGIVLVCILLILGLIGGILVLLWYKRAHRNKKSGPPAGISVEVNPAATKSDIELSSAPSGNAAPTSSEQRVHLVDTAESTPQPNRGNDSTSNTGHGTNVSSTGDADLEGGVNGAAIPLTPSSQEPPARWGHVAAIHDDKLYIWGGYIKSMSENIRKDVYIFDHQSKKWTKQTIKSGFPSIYYSCAYANADADANDKSQFVYIFGGCGINVDERSNALCCLDLENMTWTECKNTGDTPGCKSGAGMVVWNGQLVLFGGYGYRRINPPLGDDVTSFSVDPEFQQIGLGWTSDLHFYDVSKETWTIQPLKTTPCAYFSFVNIGGDRILKIGGNDGVNKASNKVHILNLRQMEWSEIKTHASGLLGRDYFSTNVLRFNKKSKYAILMLGGWQSHNEVTEEVWMCTEEHNKKGTFLNCETKNLPEQKQWLKRGYHTSSTFQMSPTHIRAVVFGGCTEFPDGIKPENYPMASGTIFIDITTSRKGVNDISKWECSIHVGTQED